MERQKFISASSVCGLKTRITLFTEEQVPTADVSIKDIAMKGIEKEQRCEESENRQTKAGLHVKELHDR